MFGYLYCMRETCLHHSVYRREWRKCIECLKLQVSFCKRETNYGALLRKMTFKDKASYGPSPPCMTNKLTTDYHSVLVWLAMWQGGTISVIYYCGSRKVMYYFGIRFFSTMKSAMIVMQNNALLIQIYIFCDMAHSNPLFWNSFFFNDGICNDI